MKLVLITLGYLKWHYGKAIKSLSNIWKNFLVFVYEFFSIRELVRNLFDPWKRMTDAYPSNFSFKSYLFAFITNSITRVVGIIMRLALLFLGVIACLLTILAFPLVLIIWLLLPLIVIIIIGDSVYLLIK